MNFINLDRCFVPLKKDQEPSLDLGRFWGPRVSGWLGWDELRRRRRVILLAEAASGKTEEFRHQCDVLNSTGCPAFFLRIEELAEQGTETALDRESAKLFEAWLTGTGEGWFFLDSVDEARLNRKSFDTALKRFAKDIGTGLERAHVYVSCRVTDWKGAEDRSTYERYLPAWKKPIIAPVAKPEDYTALLSPLFENKSPPRAAKPDKNEDNLNDLLVVQLVPLSEDQYRALATAADVKDVDQFVEAITKNGLTALTERPGDLLDLADYWKSHGQFSTFADMLEHNISRKLTERDQYRPDNEIISPEEAREGAERLAGALTFGKSFTLRAPGHDPDPSLAAGALDPAEVLPDWTDARRNALLRRGIFAPAAYGRVRFHHRSTQEYLAAKWLHRLINNNCPRVEIFQLLFAERYGVETVVPSLRAEAAWLSLWHPDIQNEVIRREPLTLLAHGDPGSLSIPVREQILLGYATKQATAEVSDERLEPRALWMFADAELAPAIRKAWQMNSREDFRFDLLRLIREGGIKDAAPLAKSVALSKIADEHHRIVAVQAAAACGDSETLTVVAKALVQRPETVKAGLASSLSLVLYPKVLSTCDLLKVIEKSHWLVEQMNARARGRFHAFREAEVAAGDKPDVIVASTSAPCEVGIEVKHGGKGWTARDLEHALRSQLAEDYLKPENRRHGVLVITHHRDRRWLRVSDNKPISFSELIAWLSEIVATVSQLLAPKELLDPKIQNQQLFYRTIQGDELPITELSSGEREVRV
jgi:hypothetical protein